MGISADTMAQILTNSRKLMSGEAQAKINNYARNAEEPYDTGNFITESTQDYTHFSEPTVGVNTNSKLPKAILESMTKHTIDCSALDPDGMANLMKKMEIQAPLSQQPKNNIKEERIIPSTVNGFDYSVLKQIIEECIDKKFRELNENTLKGVKIKDGKISLVDNSGNVFQATLEYKGKSKK